MTVTRRSALAVSAAFLIALIATVTSVAHPPKPSSPNAAVKDGCQRSDFGIGFDNSPQWVYVDRSPAIRMASGTVRVVVASLEESIQQHRSYDLNANLVPDPAFGYLVAGSPSGQSNNYAPDEKYSRGRLHFEWESATLPFFAWPSDGDRATVWGSWIWDCGHWQSTENNTGGTTSGEHTELHPLSAIAVNRRASYLSASGERETDVFISNEGDAAHAVEQCALTHHPISGTPYPQYDSGYHGCATSVANRIQPLARSYTFFVPAPPKPAAGALLRYRVVTRVPGSSGTTTVRQQANGITVTVKLPNSKHVVRYGKSFFVGWSGATANRPTALKVTFKSLLINQADPNPAVADPSGAHWNLYLDLNGYWQLLNAWAPKLTTHVVDHEAIAINHTVKVYVPRGSGVSLLVQGRECDEPAGKTILGVFANLVYPCPANTDEQNPVILDLFANDYPGVILNLYRSPNASVGTHVVTSASSVNFPGTGPTSFADVPGQGQGNFRLTYTVRRG